jgi:DDE_Tnp_1-associated/Transposase DDE domain
LKNVFQSYGGYVNLLVVNAYGLFHQGEQQFPRWIKDLKFAPLVTWLRSKFNGISDHRASNRSYPLTDVLLCGFAMFSLKDSSLLAFNNNRTNREVNLKEVYKIKGEIPSDSALRTILDKVDPEHFRSIFRGLTDQLRQAGVLREYEYYRGHLICSIDGVHCFSSEKIKCKHCLSYTKSNKHIEQRHYMLSGAIVHPNNKVVLPLVHEPIIKQDGVEKNDCERNAAKRLLPELKKLLRHEKVIVVEDGLGANGPHIRDLIENGFHYVIGVKQDGNKYLFDLIKRLEEQGKTHHFEFEKDGLLHRFHYANDLPLNSDNRDLRTNFLEYWQIDPRGKKADLYFSWTTDFRLSKNNLYEIMCVGRARWKIENETFNTLKNQGYNFEHNYGHGDDHLHTVMLMLMLLAFFVDQIQQGWNELFKAAWAKKQTKRRCGTR